MIWEGQGIVIIGDVVKDNDGDKAEIIDKSDNFLQLLFLDGPCRGRLLWAMEQDVYHVLKEKE